MRETIWRVSREARVLFLWGLVGSFGVAGVYRVEAPPQEVDQVRQALEFYEAKISEMLDIEYHDTVTVVVAEKQGQFEKILGPAFPDWGAGAAIKETNLIVIKSPLFYYVGKPLDELVGHELAHLMLDDASGGKWLPRWFEEGFCQLVSGEWRFANDVRVTRAVWGSGLIPLPALEGINRFGGAKATLAYAESYLAVTSLVQEFGLDVVPDFLQKYKQSGNFYEAFFQATGYQFSEWNNKWQRTITDRYRFVLFLFDVEILFPLLALLFILLYIIKRYQNVKKKRQWEKEERFGGYDQEYPARD